MSTSCLIKLTFVTIIMKTQKTINHTKDLISLALVQTMLKKEYENITIKEICHRAGVSRMSFYRSYNSKDDIFLDFCDARFEEFYSEYLRNPYLTLEEFIVSMFRFFKKYFRQLLILRRAGKETILINQFNGYIKYLIAHNTSDIIQAQVRNPVIGPMFGGGLYNVLMIWLDTGMEKTPEEMTKLIMAIPTIWR